MTIVAALQTYAYRIRELRRADPDVSEPALAPAMQQLLETLIPQLPSAPVLTVSAEYRNPGVGRPDIALIRPGQPPRGFVELKAPTKPGDPKKLRGHDRRQFERFCELPRWVVSNFVEFRLLARDEEQDAAIVVPEKALRPTTSDAEADRLIAAHDAADLLRVLTLLCAPYDPAARDARHLAELMAHSARLVRGIVHDRLTELADQRVTGDPLQQVRQEFRDVLYAHPEAGGYSAKDFDTLFSAAFAQTLAFGLLLVREASGVAVDERAWEAMPAEHPLMRTALRVLSLPEVAREVGVGFELMRDTVNSFAPEILAIGDDGRDPILYFYEDFLETFDPAARERYGVYYTPIEVVRYMVGALDRVLRENLGTAGLSDPDVTILDPATGTGTFLLGVAERLRADIEANASEAEARMALRDLAGRMYGFELLVGPYAVAHYRLHHALRYRRQGAAEADETPLQLPRLGVYLTDTLAEPGAAAPAGPLGFVSEGISAERRAADEVKAREPILAIIGNPPYRRLAEGENETLVGRWMDTVWDDLKAPVRDAGQGGQLNTFPEFSVAFWRWAMWKLFEAENAPRRGVVAFITNRKFLTGWPYAGLRKMMRERFDRIEIIDLRGDVRRGERGDIEADQGVFNIQVGTAITVCIADGSQREDKSAHIGYTDTWSEGRFNRKTKLTLLSDGSQTGRSGNSSSVLRDLLDDFRPRPFHGGDWISLKDIFHFSKSGMKSGNDSAFISVYPQDLRAKVTPILLNQSEETYNSTLEMPLAYRPFDYRWFYNDRQLLDRPGPAMLEAWGAANYGLYALPSGTGGGPGVWCHSVSPDYHAFRGSYGGFAFPLYDRRLGINPENISNSLLFGLRVTYGRPVTAPDVFDAILALLSATSYTRRFAEDLEDTFPHVPFPSDHAVFDRAVAVGREIRGLEAFQRAPAAQSVGFCQLADEPSGDVAASATAYSDGGIALCADGSGRITGIPEPVWRFAVSGYRVLPRWIEGRVGLPANLAFVRDLRDIAARIAELIHRFDEADLVLADALADTIPRAELGFADPEPADSEDER